jgi:hypothetical protein
VKCYEFVEFIADYTGDGLAPGVRTAFERHLRLCSACRRYLDHYLQSLALGRRAFDADDTALPASVPEELIAGILLARRTSTGNAAS